MAFYRLFTTHLNWWYKIKIYVHMIIRHQIFEMNHCFTFYRQSKFGMKLVCDYCDSTILSIKQRQKEDVYIISR